MRCPTLDRLPPPPPGKTGWPWTEESPPVPDRMPDGRPWPRVSIVTPSYNQDSFLEETIRSVLLQGYPDLEYLVMDGGSTDGSVDIIRRYSPWLASWVSELDRGQTHAINKGLGRVTGEIVAWLNADDTYMPGAFSTVAAVMSPGGGPAFVYADCRQIDEASRPLGVYRGACDGLESFHLFRAHVHQPTIFFRRALLEEVGSLDESLDFAMDVEFYMRVAARHDFRYIPGVLANFRIHPASKTSQDFLGSIRERIAVGRRHRGAAGLLRRLRYLWAERQQEAGAHLHCSYLHLGRDHRTALRHIARGVALYPPILFGREATSQLLQVVIGPKGSVALKRWLGRPPARHGSAS
ncbi:MAG: glycosyltransferase [candidate division NC10 bacterium]|nr:glycosyltransferase [candidate division NC10 bacterium]MBI2115685.1 glycosyltransferase [candidate division NC10 bacterium]MBI2456221.1 glycosyltransferase [candidate division NC10 bacterium]